MNIRSGKGFALAMAIYFMLVCLISSIALYTTSYYLTKEVVIQEESSTRGYYAALAGLRYADMALKDLAAAPAPKFAFGSAAHNGEISTINISKATVIGQEIGLDDNDVLTITATEWSSAAPTDPDFPNWADGEYRVTAVFDT
ncbi:MAG: hypothetical protein NTY34_00920 [Candidatus Omnitrophica bacterium]|nr:hypothetical protein [Candidatus Omnitrophota bacterium]